MKVAILNLSGNVGKTAIASHLLTPRMEQPTVYSIESINIGAESEGIAVEKLPGKKFGAMIDEMMQLDSVIVDVGASNVEEFLKRMQQFDGSHEDFDYFVVPVLKDEKIQRESVKTVRALNVIGVDRNRVRIIFNRVEVDEPVIDDFSGIFGLANSENSCIVNEDASIHQNEIFPMLKTVGKSLHEIHTDTTDYKARLRAAESDDERSHCIRMIAMKRLAVTATKNLDVAFAALFAKQS